MEDIINRGGGNVLFGEVSMCNDDITTYDYENKERAAIPVRRKENGDIEYPENTWRYRFLKNT